MFFVFLSFLLSEIKIGYLNADKILSELDEVRQVQIELEKEQRKIESEYQDLKWEVQDYHLEVKCLEGILKI
jgi:Skp family chaperone for outer membrane proteins